MSTKSPATKPRRIALELRHDARDNRHRWYIQETDEDTEVSGVTPEDAWKDAAQVWRGSVWNFERVSDTIAMIDADEPPMTGADWAERYYAMPLADAMRQDGDDTEPWIVDLRSSEVLFYALDHGDHGAYHHALRAARENLPEPLANAIAAIGEYAQDHPDDHCAWLTFGGVIGGARHYRSFVHALAAFTAEEVAHA